MSSQEPRNIRKETLPNGLIVLTESMPHVRSIAVGIWLRTGSRQENPQRNGITHFIEHMVFKGTRNRTAEQIARSMDSVGGHLDAFTAKECVSFNTVVLDQHLKKAFDVLSDLVLNPLFKPEDVTREQKVVLEEIKSEEDNPEYLLHELFTQGFWKGHALGKPILGTRKTVQALTREAIREQFSRFYRPNNMVIAAAGHLRHAQILDLVQERFHRVKPHTDRFTDPSPVIRSRITLKNKPALEQVQLCLGVPSYPLTHERRYACYVLNTLLGGGMSSRLFQTIREKQGLAYAVFSELTPYKDTGCLLVYAGTSRESAPRVVSSIIEQFRDLKENGVGADELQRAKDHLKGSLMLSLESTASRMSNLARQQMYFGRFLSLDEMIANIDAVTTKEIDAITSDFFQTERISLTVLGRLDGLKIDRKMLAC
ncbi:MAG: peptidase M16 [Acidobacteria bacterium RIFCSPLOWO2_02_FULL_61_28]|nr:MAG: peptidase M16 [Acidobacteria bacterium RIFCSPLOWO2_02_FULL_61_28]